MRLLVVAIIWGYFQSALASCVYSDYASTWVLAADDNCVNFYICEVNNVCQVNYFVKNPSSPVYTNFWAVGNMKNYNFPTLDIKDAKETTLRDMILPNVVKSLTFTNILKLNLVSAKTISWPNVNNLRIIQCPDSVQNLGQISWPEKLTSLDIQESGLKDLTGLPSDITYFQLFNNDIEAVINKDWRAAAFINVGKNPLETFAFVKLSSALKFFYCYSVKLSNITIDEGTAIVLNSLNKWNGDDNNLVGFAVNRDVQTDPIKCAAIGGVIRQLFEKQKSFNITACVLGSSLPTTSPMATTLTTTLVPNNVTVADSSSSPSTGIIVGVIVGAIGLVGIGIVIFVFIRRGKRLTRQSTQDAPYHSYDDMVNPHPKSAENYAHQPYRELNTERTQGTGRSVGTGNSQGSKGRLSVHLDNDIAELDLTYLLHHRLVLADLIVTSNKPLATGAFGEVWLGSYGAQQVAIKRLKSRQPRQVQKFIDEIILMSQLDSDYIVKFVGASWTRPIEIECVVEYMDLGDLRSYLVSQSPQQFTWEKKYQSIVSIVRGLVYLHTYKPQIIHRDLKSRNVLLDSVKGTKLTDFGTSRVAEEDDLMTNGIGTYQWMAPEVIAGTNYSSPADIYSFGIILSEFCTHQVPYAGHRNPLTGNLLSQLQILSEVREGRLHPSFDGEDVPAWVKDVAMRCLQLNEYDRPTALELSAIFARIKP